MKVTDFIGVKATYDEHGQYIWGVNKDGGHQKLADLRGWGAIQNLFKSKSGLVDDQKAAGFQDELGKWIVEAINEKLEREQLQKPPVTDWVAVSERLPEIPKDTPSYAQHVKVIACWGNRVENVAQMDYCRRIVRGKEVYRFEWMGKISPWKVDYWMEFPKPPNYL